MAELFPPDEDPQSSSAHFLLCQESKSLKKKVEYAGLRPTGRDVTRPWDEFRLNQQLPAPSSDADPGAGAGARA